MVANKTNILKYSVIALLVFVPNFISAQCAMCRAVLENSDDTSAAEGVNNGIVFLMAMPYLLVGVIGFIIYKKFRN